MKLLMLMNCLKRYIALFYFAIVDTRTEFLRTLSEPGSGTFYPLQPLLTVLHTPLKKQRLSNLERHIQDQAFSG